MEIVQEDSREEAGSATLQMMQTVQSEIARLQEKSDFILVPLWQGLGDAAQKIKDLHQEFTKETMARMLALEFSRESFYNVCMELGLCFNQRLGRIRRIYFQTLADEGTPV